jgi:hypothetical protein
MTHPQQDMFGGGGKASKKRDRAEAGADQGERKIVCWIKKALELMKQYLSKRRGAPFMADDFVLWMKYRIEDPPDPRAWGHVMRAAKRKGLIKGIGYAPSKSSNGSPKVQWQAAA